MKQAIPWVIAVGCAGLAIGALLHGGAPTAVGPGAVAPGQAAAPVEGAVVHTFADDEKMKEFGATVQQRFGINQRIGVLQTYWNGEQAALAKVNEQLQSQYQVDPAKEYVLDGEHRALREQPVPPPAAEGQAAAPPPAEPGPVAHTFANDEEIRTFSGLWQQRLLIRARMAMLQTYWNQEQTHLTQINKTLADQYQMDANKNYFLDGQRRVLVERPAPASAGKEKGAEAAPPKSAPVTSQQSAPPKPATP